VNGGIQIAISAEKTALVFLESRQQLFVAATLAMHMRECKFRCVAAKLIHIEKLSTCWTPVVVRMAPALTAQTHMFQSEIRGRVTRGNLKALQLFRLGSAQ
jgi:hypothetical protein